MTCAAHSIELPIWVLECWWILGNVIIAAEARIHRSSLNIQIGQKDTYAVVVVVKVLRSHTVLGYH